MELALVIYLIGAFAKLGEIAAGALKVLTVVGIFAAAALVVFWDDVLENERELVLLKQAVRAFAWALGLCFVFVVFLPSQKTAYTMLAAYGGQSLVESDDFKRMAPKSLQILEKYMDEKLAEQEDHGAGNENKN